VEFDRTAAHRSIQSVRPGMHVFEVSAKSGEGLDPWLRFLEARIVQFRQYSVNKASELGN
jgi:hydrogenase nickel incorporation protein HypB